MKWTRTQLLRDSLNVEFDEDIEIENSAFDKSVLINGVKDVHVSGKGFLDDDNDCFIAAIEVTGIMLCPDAITGEEIEVPFETESEELYSFVETDEDGARIVTDEVIELLPAVIDDILLEAPLQVTEAAEEDYPHGDGWRVISEAEYQESRKDQIDPRLAILKEFKNE